MNIVEGAVDEDYNFDVSKALQEAFNAAVVRNTNDLLRDNTTIRLRMSGDKLVVQILEQKYYSVLAESDLIQEAEFHLDYQAEDGIAERLGLLPFAKRLRELADKAEAIAMTEMNEKGPDVSAEDAP